MVPASLVSQWASTYNIIMSVPCRKIDTHPDITLDVVRMLNLNKQQQPQFPVLLVAHSLTHSHIHSSHFIWNVAFMEYTRRSLGTSLRRRPRPIGCLPTQYVTSMVIVWYLTWSCLSTSFGLLLLVSLYISCTLSLQPGSPCVAWSLYWFSIVSDHRQAKANTSDYRQGLPHTRRSLGFSWSVLGGRCSPCVAWSLYWFSIVSDHRQANANTSDYRQGLPHTTRSLGFSRAVIGHQSRHNEI